MGVSDTGTFNIADVARGAPGPGRHIPAAPKGLVIVTLHKQFDAAYPPASAPPGCTIVAGYIGGSEALNVWTPAEWQRFETLYQVPIWVPDTSGDPKTQASEACAAAKTLGWGPYLSYRRLIVFDLELAEVPAWYASVAAEVAAQGYQAAAYGSLSTVLANKAAVVWSADWDGDYALDHGQSIEASQYAADVAWDNTQVDYSAASEWWTTHCGVGRRLG
jgi:hypothetical protein